MYGDFYILPYHGRKRGAILLLLDLSRQSSTSSGIVGRSRMAVLLAPESARMCILFSSCPHHPVHTGVENFFVVCLRVWEIQIF